MVDMAHPDIGGEPTLYTAHQAYREFISNQLRPHNLAALPQMGWSKETQTLSRLDPQNGCVIRYPRRNLDEFRLPALRTGGLALSWAGLGVTQLEPPRLANIEVLEDLCNTMKFGSLCALGGFTPYQVISTLNHFPKILALHRACKLLNRRRAMSLVQQSLVQEIDYGTPRSKSEKMVSLSIDGKQISVPEGTSIMRAAMETGIEIPKLCATDMLDAFGSCRLCLVEIEGRGGTPASCTTPVAEGIVVRTKSERLDRLRKGVMELYVSDHPVDSLDRAKHAGFDLLDTAAAVGLEEVRYGFDGARHRNPGVDDLIRISPSTPPSASSARAVCGRARKCRARSR